MIKAVVIGTSFGGMEAIKTVLCDLTVNFHLPVICVLHIGNNNIKTYISILNDKTVFTVKEAEEKEILQPKTVYFAPPNYHLQIEKDFTLSLSTDKKVNYSRPSIDVLFETAAWAYKNELLGVLLTGSNRDGAEGLQNIKEFGGITIVENPATALANIMPETAIIKCEPNYVLDLELIPGKLMELCKTKN